MDLSKSTLWQVAGGSRASGRRFDDICLKYDVMMVGDGNGGEYLGNEEVYDIYEDGSYANRLNRFYNEARRGDLVLLRFGTSEVLAVGVIDEETGRYRTQFSDVDRWNLSHTRRVRWFEDTATSFSSRTFGGQAYTFARVGVDEVQDWVRGLDVSEEELDRPLRQLPPEPNFLELGELGDQQFAEGLPRDKVDELLNTIRAVRRIAKWYEVSDEGPEDRPSEDETITYLVIPLLQALGWSEQTAAIEWNDIDIALFRRMPPSPESLRCVVEAKSLDSSLFGAVDQAEVYATRDLHENCESTIVTDGTRYLVLKATDEGFEREAYLNLMRPQESYPIIDASGASEALRMMSYREAAL